MSVVVSDACGWLLDSHSFINEHYVCCLTKHGCSQQSAAYTFKREYFNIERPYIVSKPTENGETGQSMHDLKTPSAVQKGKGRKRKRSLNQGELDSEVYHDKIRLLVQEGTRSLVEMSQTLGYMIGVVASKATETMTPPDCHLADMCDMAKSLHLDDGGADDACPQSIWGDDDALDLFSRLTENPRDQSCEMTLMRGRYLIPPRCKFLLSDITCTQPLRNSGETFDLIVLDPPWENKSVKRSSRYSFLPSSQLKQLPVDVLSSPECLVVTWVTNRPRHLRFVKEELYPHWGVQVLAEWLWVKVTRAGEFVFPLDSPHKKPYELMVLGRKSYNSTSSNETVATRPSPGCQRSLSSAFPKTLTLRCLELFARNLQSDWTSWGNEVLKFQHISYFTKDSTNTHQPNEEKAHITV
ncbi:N(6)-adenine-specific methyltransferase METTL4 isoform X3 [Engraulis encrasicolus]|uniref:N(6)-adenine-specific methyltransferase METTL4 isoform X3 n=1 Tax=Engraulis encrasicolus TaxID=184585 RepID=UPI002FCF6940